MRYLFFFVHPSKFHVFRETINRLKDNGHKVDILIASKDVLEELIVNEGWEYTNICPHGRKIKNIHPLISSFVYFFITIYRLWRFTWNIKYDLFITDDLLVYIGKLKRVPSIAFCDDDLKVVKMFSLVLSKATRILAPDITDLGKYNHKKIGFPGYKELAYLHPNTFTPDISIVNNLIKESKPYFVLRLVSLSAYHDVGKKGLSDENVSDLIALFSKYGNVYISSEKKLSKRFERYRLIIKPENMKHVLYFSDLFVGDSMTMCSEAAVLGIPAFRCNDFIGTVSVMNEKEEYGLSYGYRPSQFNEMYSKIESLLAEKKYKEKYKEKRDKMLNEKIDLSSFMTWYFQNFKNINVKDINFDDFKLRRGL